MKQPLHTFLIALTITVLFLPKISAAEHLSVEESLRERIESAAEILDLSIDNQPLNSQKGLITFYSDRQFTKAWLANGQPTPQAYQLMQILNSADQHGLNKSNYHVTAINERLERLKAPLDESEILILSVDLDLLLSDAFLTYGTHLIQGQVNPQTLQSKWDTGRRATDMVKILTDAINNNSIEQSLNELMPKQPGYLSLVRALADYRAIKDRGGWSSVTEGPSLRPDEKNPRIIQLRKRLAASGDLPNDTVLDSKEFDRPLQQAVKYFQKRHGLETDSIVGRATLAALNVSVDQRIAQIRANLERWRWLPEDLGARHIMVNIAGFELDFVGNGEVLLHMPVIVGKTYRETPVFTGSMTYLVINPSWYVPNSIAVKDKLPILARDPYYIERNHMKLYRGWGADRREIDPLSVNWQRVDPNSFPYRLVQKPGPKNAMGKVKFMFPNPHNVYLHDTSEPSLFNRVDRTFSSGCIRVGKPFALANLVLENNSRMTPDAIRAAFDQSDQKTVTLLNPIPVHILYWTAWVDSEGVVQFRRDIYSRDDELIQKLQKPF